MHTLVNQGQICYWGTSEWTTEQIIKAYEIANTFNLTPPTMEQPQYNLLERYKMEKDYLPVFDKYQLGTTIWSPLGSGILSVNTLILTHRIRTSLKVRIYQKSMNPIPTLMFIIKSNN